jgi:hypothetical protein
MKSSHKSSSKKNIPTSQFSSSKGADENRNQQQQLFSRSMIDLVDLRLTRPPDALRPITGGGSRLSPRAKTPYGVAGVRDYLQQNTSDIKPGTAGGSGKRKASSSVDEDTASAIMSKKMHTMIVNFCSEQNSVMKLDIDLRKYAIESGDFVTNATVQEMCTVQPGLTRLDVSNCVEVSDVGLWAVARHCTDLRELVVAGCRQMTHVGLRSLSLRCAQVVTLDFSYCPLLDDIALTVIASGNWHLEKLILRGCTGITDTGVGKVAKASDRLRYLDLNG